MDTFKCFECGLTSKYQLKVGEHMAQSHGIEIKTEELEMHNFCSECSYTFSNMAEFKNHMKNGHNKGDHNWMTDIRAEFYCRECEIIFPKKTLFINQMEKNPQQD